MKLKNVFQLALLATVLMFTAPSCVKEGPMGPSGEKGADGTNGTDANQTCKACHNPTSVDLIATQFEFSKHSYGEAAFGEAGQLACTPCHAQEAFKYVVKNNVLSTFSPDPAKPGKFINNYATVPSAAYGKIGCSTCHSSIHSTYGSTDMVFTTVAPVPMTMWAGAKIIDLKQDNGSSNLCVKCHQPRPQTNLQTGNVQDYNFIRDNPSVLAFDSINPTATTNIVTPSYRMHIHYGAIGAVFAGMGGIEFVGLLPYTSSAHTTKAACTDCHMGAIVGRSGGHTFSALGKFDGCNATGCHSTAIDAKNTTLWINPRAEIKTLLDNLAAKLVVVKANGTKVDILNRNSDAVSNLWIGITTNNYDGYLNVYDPTLAPNAGLQNSSPGGSWSADQKALNLKLPKVSLTNAQYGAIINFQLCLRDYSLGIHNFNYTKALLTNSIAKL